MATIRNITLLLLCGLGFLVGDAFGQEENCNKGERGDRAAMRGGEAGARGGGPAEGQESAGQGLSPQQTAERMLSNFDADGDGTLNMQELTNGLEALQQSMRQQRGQGTDQQSQRGQGGSGQQQASNDGQRQRQGRSSVQVGQGNSARGGRGGSQRRGR